MKRVLVITMYCGEPQYEQCCRSVSDQVGVYCEHKVIANKPNVEAHKELYETINSLSDNYDFFVKLDADMEFASTNSLGRLLDYFDDDTDHLTIPVFDYFINADMPMFHIYTNRVRFNTREMDSLYVDNVSMSYPGFKKSIGKSHSLVFHCFNASLEQSYAFGVHRAMKVVQKGRLAPHLSASKYHFETLLAVYNNFKLTQSIKLHYVLSGAVSVFMDRHSNTMENKAFFYKSESSGIPTVELDRIFGKGGLAGLLLVLKPLRFSIGLSLLMYNRMRRRLILIKQRD